MVTTRLISFLVALVVSLCASSAFAQTKEEVKQAQQHFQKGAEWFAQGEYAKAVVEFMSGHALAPNAMFLYNVSLAYERLDNIPDALSAARKSKQFSGMPDEVKPRNEARIVAFELMLDAEQNAEDLQRAIAEAQEEEDATETTTEPEMVTRPDGIGVLGFAGIALATVGGGFAVGGLITNAAINGEIEDYESAARTGDRESYADLRERIETRQRNGKIFYAVGAAAAGVGATLFVIDLFTGTETVPASAWLAPTSNGASAGLVLRFR